METLHTKGDWYASNGQIVAQDTGKTLAVIPYYDNTDEEQTANANLMAAAPVMLSILKTLDEYIDKSELPPKMRYKLNEAIQKAINP